MIYSSAFCPFCVGAKRLLDNKCVQYKEISVDCDTGKRQEMIKRASRFTVPQIWVGDAHVGGYDELCLLDRAGDLDGLLMDAEGTLERE